jgi:hypothetical protein
MFRFKGIKEIMTNYKKKNKDIASEMGQKMINFLGQLIIVGTISGAMLFFVL